MFQNFYPRSPCGERRIFNCFSNPGSTISIHALLAESDLTSVVNSTGTMDFYPRSPCGERHTHPITIFVRIVISIHALLAESDAMQIVVVIVHALFLSTLSLRRATNANLRGHRINDDFYPRSPCGERHADSVSKWTAT